MIAALTTLVLQPKCCAALNNTNPANDVLSAARPIITTSNSAVFPDGVDQQTANMRLILPIHPSVLSRGTRQSKTPQETTRLLKGFSDLEAKISRKIVNVERWTKKSLGGTALQKAVRAELSTKQWEAWGTFSWAMRRLNEKDKCGPVYLAVTKKYSICCVFKVGRWDSNPYSYVSSCIDPHFLVKPSPLRN